MTIYLDWLSLPKDQFKILMYLLDTKQSSFSVDSILNYFMKGKSSKNLKSIKASLLALEEKGWIDLSISKDTVHARIISQKKSNVEIDERIFKIDDFSKKGFTVSVDWGTALQVFFAILIAGKDYKRREIASITGLNEKTISRAVKMLRRNFEDIDYKVNKVKTEEGWKTIGTHFELGAFGLVRKE